MKEVPEDGEDWTVYWTDYSVSLERVMEMKRFQKINHFPGMNEICRKDLLARNLNRLYKLFPKDYCLFPKSWSLPADYSDFQAHCRTKKNKTYICKPESGCQGKGIFITRNPKDIKPGEHMICQQYLTKCFTIDNYKFDLRIYVLVTSCDPLRIFVYKEGLARFATKKYQEPNNHNMDEVCMHLTNYAINKNSDDFVRDDDSGSKRKLAAINQWLDEHGYDTAKMWANIEDVIIKTLISAHPILKHNYRTCFPNHLKGSACFEILGFDVLLDKKLKAWILEVNHSPSFHTDAKLDKEVKEGLLYDTFNLLDLRSIDRRKCLEEDRKRVKERLLAKPKSRESKLEEMKTNQMQYLEVITKYEDQHMGGFRRIYPGPGAEKYDKYFENSCSLFQTTAASKAREEAAKAQREEIRIKQEKKDAMMKGRPYKPDIKKEAGEAGGDKKRRSIPGVVPFRHRPATRRLTTGHQMRSRSPDEILPPLDTSKPLDISEDEELERISSLLQRDSLVRSLGVVEQVHRLLHSTPGTTGLVKSMVPHGEFGDGPRLNGISIPGILMNSALRVQPHPPMLSSSGARNHNNPPYGMITMTQYQAASALAPTRQRVLGQLTNVPAGTTGGSNNPGQLYSITSIGHSSAPHRHSRYMAVNSFNQPANGFYGKSIGKINSSKTYVIPDGQVNLANHNILARNVGSSINSQNSGLSASKFAYRQKHDGTVEWKLDNAAVAFQDKNRRVYSAGVRNRENSATRGHSGHSNSGNERQGSGYINAGGGNDANTNGLPSVIKVTAANNDLNLSVVSGPAPVAHRSELLGGVLEKATVIPPGSRSNLDSPIPSLRTTKSERIRGATNNLRIKQLELRENRATVIS
uniref:tubulin polyglutamylase ttll6-like n=1 Tax=Styela clava TaxID=7725 RepID=UPI00193ABCCD|nr:tubulin polyglutamylase ttll6-like [Styela clava]